MITFDDVLKYISSLGPLIALAALIYEVRETKLSHSTDVILKLSERFNNSEMRKIRAKAAKKLLKQDDIGDVSVDDILNFFEEIGLLLETKSIRLRPTWALFYYWVSYYYEASIIYRNEYQKSDPNLHKGLDFLYKSLEREELKQRRFRSRFITKEERKEQFIGFLEQEASLDLNNTSRYSLRRLKKYKLNSFHEFK